ALLVDGRVGRVAPHGDRVQDLPIHAVADVDRGPAGWQLDDPSAVFVYHEPRLLPEPRPRTRPDPHCTDLPSAHGVKDQHPAAYGVGHEDAPRRRVDDGGAA